MRVQDLPIEVRLKLVEDLWDSIATDQKTLPLTDAQRAELDSRLDEFEMDGELGEPSDVVLAQIRQNFGATLIISRSVPRNAKSTTA